MFNFFFEDYDNKFYNLSESTTMCLNSIVKTNILAILDSFKDIQK